MFSFFRELVSVLRGEASFISMFLGIFLGFAIGMIPGINLTLLIFILLFLVLNANAVLAGLAFVVGKACCFALAPVTYHIGYFMIHDLGFDGVVKSFSDTPILALMDLHIYSVLGSLVIILIVGVVVSWLLARILVKTREKITVAKGNSEKLEALSSKKLVRFMTWLAVGSKDDVKASNSLFSGARIVLGMIVVLIIIGINLLLVNSFARIGMERTISSMTGAEVNINKADISITKGKLELLGLQVTDSDKPTHNEIQADRMVADISIIDLFTKRIVLDQVVFATMEFDVQRQKPGKVYLEKKKKEEDDIITPEEEGSFGKVKAYLDTVKKLNRKFQGIREYLASNDQNVKEKLSKDENNSADNNVSSNDKGNREKMESYLRRSARDKLVRNPLWVIKEIDVEKLKIAEDWPSIIVKGENISSHPSLYPDEMALKAYPEPGSMKILGRAIKDAVVDGVKSGAESVKDFGDKAGEKLREIFE